MIDAAAVNQRFQLRLRLDTLKEEFDVFDSVQCHVCDKRDIGCQYYCLKLNLQGKLFLCNLFSYFNCYFLVLT